MTMLDEAWEELRAEMTDSSADLSGKFPMPIWDSLRKSMSAEAMAAGVY